MGRRYRKPVLIAVLILAVVSLPSFLQHYLYWVSGQAEAIVVQQRWDFVLLNIAGFLLFLIPLKYRRKTDWRSHGIYAAFIVSLFVEMYGIPLSIYLSSSVFLSGSPGVFKPVVSFSFLGQQLAMNTWMLVGLSVTVLGGLLVVLGWYRIYNEGEQLVTSGIYGYSRHPQYLGIILLAMGWFIGWPTLLTSLLFPVLVYSYYKAAKREEREVESEVGEETYQRYRQEVPMFI